MCEITFQEFYNRENKNLIEISKETGLSVSLLSRLKNGDITLTKKTQEIFELIYNVKLIPSNREKDYKNKIKSLNEHNLSLSEKIKQLNDENNQLKEKNVSLMNKKRIIEMISKTSDDIFNNSTTEKIIKLLEK